MVLDPTIFQGWHPLLFNAVLLMANSVLTFLQRDSFLYWPFLISTVVIGALAWRYLLVGSVAT